MLLYRVEGRPVVAHRPAAVRKAMRGMENCGNRRGGTSHRVQCFARPGPAVLHDAGGNIHRAAPRAMARQARPKNRAMRGLRVDDPHAPLRHGFEVVVAPKVLWVPKAETPVLPVPLFPNHSFVRPAPRAFFHPDRHIMRERAQALFGGAVESEIIDDRADDRTAAHELADSSSLRQRQKSTAAVLSASQRKPAPNPLTSVVITIAGKNVTNWAPTRYGSTASRSAVATPTDTTARA
jgi:hypothetical protein